jgi:Gas vesicle synthesis protein GvpL/GvpF
MNQASSSASSAGIYVYCVARAEPFANGSAHFEATGIGGRGDPVRTVAYEDLVAIVSDSPKQRYELRREYLLGHERVLEEAMQWSDLLPVSFSTIASTEEAIREKLLKKRFDELHGYLEYVQNRTELGLKALWNQEQLFAEVVADNEEIQALQASVAGQVEDASYYDRIQLGQLTEAAIAAKRDAEAEAILDALEPLAVDTHVNKNFMEMMILNAAFLVDKDQEPAFDARVSAMGEAQAGRLVFQYVGPLPPYDFVTLKVRWEG